MQVDTTISNSNEIAVEEESPLASVVVEYEDTELSSFSRRLEHWSAVLKNSLLAEYEDNRNSFTINMKSENETIKKNHQEQVDGLRMKLDLETASLSDSNQKLELKEKLVNNLTLFYAKKDRNFLLRRTFILWRDALEANIGIKIAFKLARRHRDNFLLMKIVKGWRCVVESNWKKGVEIRIHRVADFRIAMAAKESDQQIKKLERNIQSLESQLLDARNGLKLKQDEMRSAFLRGVSALNAQAIGIFKDGDHGTSNLLQDGQKLLNFVSNTTATSYPPSTATSKVIYATNTSNGSLSTTKGLVTRHFPAK